ncbi:MAG: PAS domain S-box protein [Alphaproteobacteria bacterium]
MSTADNLDGAAGGVRPVASLATAERQRVGRSAETPPPSVLRDPLPWIFAAVAVALLVGLAMGLGGFGASSGVHFVALATAGVLAFVGFAALLLATARRRSTQLESALWRSIGDVLPYPCFVVDRNGRAAYGNESFRRRWLDNAHAPLAALKQFVGQDPGTSDRLARLFEQGRSGLVAGDEFEVSGPDGRRLWLLISVRPMGNAGHALWYVEDTSERHRFEEDMRSELARLSDLVEHAPIGIYSVDGEGRFLHLNKTFAAWVKLSADEITRRDIRLRDLLLEAPPSGSPPHRPFGGEKEVSSGEVVFRAGEQPFHALVSQTVTTDSARDGIVTRSVVRDRTPELEWEAALRRSEQRYQRFFEEAPTGIVLLDDDGRIVESNDAWRALVAPDQTSLEGRNLTEFVTEDDASKVAGWLEQSFRDGTGAKSLDVNLRANIEGERERVATMFASRLYKATGEIDGLILHFLETTDRRNLEVQFAQGRKMQAVGQLAGGIAHDFNNLLTAMIGFCDLLLLRHSPGDQSFGDIMQIKQNASRAANLVRQLLAFSRQQTLQPTVLNITDVIADLSNLLRRLIGANIHLTMVHGRGLGLIRVDQGQLEQVIINLAVNARDAMAEGGELTITTKNITLTKPQRRDAEVVPPGDYVVIELADTGCGIPSENVEHIFEPFFTTKEVGAGTGLGLSTVYGIVKQTEGFIFLEETSPDGTTFAIYLPGYQAEEAPDKIPRDSAGAPEKADLTGAGTVLLVEDEDAVRLFSARALRAKGYKVLEARTGEAALELVDMMQEQVDLLITDIVMPQMDGPTLIKKVRATAPELKVICISGYAEDAVRKRLDESSDIHFLPKPFSLAELAAKVKDVMSAPAG